MDQVLLMFRVMFMAMVRVIGGAKVRVKSATIMTLVLLPNLSTRDTAHHNLTTLRIPPPDYRFNLYVKGLAPAMTTRSLFELFKPYGHILACKTIQDNDTGLCRGGFVLFDNQESCTEARRALTQQGLYVAVAHESASIKHIPAPEIASPETKTIVPELDNSEAFPSLPSKPLKKKQQLKATSPSPSTKSPKPESVDHPDLHQFPAPSALKQVDIESFPEAPLGDCSFYEPSETHHDDNNRPNGSFTLGQSYLDFDGGFIGMHHQFLSDGFSSSSKFERRPSLLDRKATWSSVSDIDQYMNMLELSTASVIPQASANTEGARQVMYPHEAHISNTVIDDFILEDRPRRETTLYFYNLPEGLKHQQLFELCAPYGPLVLTLADIRYINEECSGQGKVTFESYRDSETALSALCDLHYTVRRHASDMYSSEPAIEDNLYYQYYQQHQDFMRVENSAPCESPDEPLSSTYQQDFFQVNIGMNAFMPPTGEAGEHEYSWNIPFSDKPFSADVNACSAPMTALEVDLQDLTSKHEKFSMLGISPQPISFSPASSSSSPLPIFQESPQTVTPEHEAEQLDSSDASQLHRQECDSQEHDTTLSPDGSSKLLSYSDIVKVPPAPKPVLSPPCRDEPYANPPSQDLKRRGNTNKSLDEKEYGLNLYLKDLEPTMDEFKLYEICVRFGPVMSCRTITTHHGVCTGLGFVMYTNIDSVERAIKGLKDFGYHAEIAVQSATNKLRCKVKSDTLFLQNIPSHIKENKLRDLFRPFHIMTCNILKDYKTGKNKGVAFLKMKDIQAAERFIEEYHGRVLGKDWKLPLQVSPAKH
ncbi:hypothetical protein BG011_002513 [Mortierella polycephala]|uniref:RRM domain-containing protein n=1 Tax=Mortierella polycephala TaxID=41804 RepID=A0A9P6U518_9FUNG|nr:hypothetical protein BG011_002513 [Mortierella polycephala]